jgi:SAM-dependent methyltransferase
LARPSKKPYVRFAEVYDQIMSDVPYSRWADYIMTLWGEYDFHPKTVLDLACGTGNLTAILASFGYQVTGLDASSNMLAVAKSKMKARRLYADFVRKDMRSFSIDPPVDAAVCVFDSLNYLLEPIDLQMAYKSVSASIEQGGLFIFDVNTRSRLASIANEVSLMQGDDHFVIWADSYDAGKQWWKVQLTGFIKQGDVWARFDEVHKERAFPIEDHKAWLKDAGFKVLAVYESCTFHPATEASSRVYFVAEKKEQGGSPQDEQPTLE